MNKMKILIICIVAMLLATVFSVNSISAGSGDENRSSNSQRIGDDYGDSAQEPERNRAEDRTRYEDR